jgi:hypothetical protein
MGRNSVICFGGSATEVKNLVGGIILFFFFFLINWLPNEARFIVFFIALQLKHMIVREIHLSIIITLLSC